MLLSPPPEAPADRRSVVGQSPDAVQSAANSLPLTKKIGAGPLFLVLRSVEGAGKSRHVYTVLLRSGSLGSEAGQVVAAAASQVHSRIPRC